MSIQSDPLKRIEDALVARGRSRRALHDLLRRVGTDPTPEALAEVERRVQVLDAAEAEVARLARAFST